jgi:hypothetical protein
MQRVFFTFYNWLGAEHRVYFTLGVRIPTFREEASEALDIRPRVGLFPEGVRPESEIHLET